MPYISFNGAKLPAGDALLPVNDRGFRYGYGLFETMKMVAGKLPLATYHFNRLFSGLDTLKLKPPSLFSPQQLTYDIAELCQENGCEQLARIRLSVSGGAGSLINEPGNFQWLIECQPLSRIANEWNEKGLSIDIYPDARKACDKFSNLKSANFIPYLMAANHARQQKLDDCLVLNAREAIADSSIANIFLVKNNTIFTPALSEGCVDGVMRKFLLEKLNSDKTWEVKEISISVEDLTEADEVFLTNAVQGIRWVMTFRDREYRNNIAKEISDKYVRLLNGVNSQW